MSRRLPKARVPYQVLVVKQAGQVEAAVQQLLDDYHSAQYHAFGIDFEWKPNTAPHQSNPIATIQISGETTGVVFQMLNLGGMPRSLEAILMSSKYLKIGHSLAREDSKNLLRDFGITMSGTADVHTLAEELGYSKVSLAHLTAVTLGMFLDKKMTVSNWAKPILSAEQVEYAATDAWVTREVYYVLQQNFEGRIYFLGQTLGLFFDSGLFCCPHCDFGCHRLEECAEHIGRSKHSESPMHFCRGCNFRTTRQQYKAIHEAQCADMNKRKPAPAASSSKIFKHVCEKCRNEFKTDQDLRSHACPVAAVAAAAATTSAPRAPGGPPYPTFEIGFVSVIHPNSHNTTTTAIAAVSHHPHQHHPPHQIGTPFVLPPSAMWPHHILPTIGQARPPTTFPSMALPPANPALFQPPQTHLSFPPPASSSSAATLTIHEMQINSSSPSSSSSSSATIKRCDICRHSFDSEMALRSHDWKKHYHQFFDLHGNWTRPMQVSAPTVTAAPRAAPTSHYCAECRREFSSEKDIYNHDSSKHPFMFDQTGAWLRPRK